MYTTSYINRIETEIEESLAKGEISYHEAVEMWKEMEYDDTY